MKPILVCQKGGICREIATHCLIYIDKTSFKEIVDKPKYMCYHHCMLMQSTMMASHRVMSRIYTVDEFTRRVEAWEIEKKVMLRERWEKFYGIIE